MRLLLNIIWFVLAGLWMAIGYAIAALIMFVLIITIPFGIASLRIAMYALWPFGRTIVRHPSARRRLDDRQRDLVPARRAGGSRSCTSLTGIALCLTIIGIPLGLANFKLIPVSLTPLGREIVDVDEARRRGYDGVGIDAPLPQ